MVEDILFQENRKEVWWDIEKSLKPRSVSPIEAKLVSLFAPASITEYRKLHSIDTNLIMPPQTAILRNELQGLSIRDREFDPPTTLDIERDRDFVVVVEDRTPYQGPIQRASEGVAAMDLPDYVKPYGVGDKPSSEDLNNGLEIPNQKMQSAREETTSDMAREMVFLAMLSVLTV